MQRRLILYLLISLTLASTALAKPITEGEARAIAGQFMASRNLSSTDLQFASKAMLASNPRTLGKTAYYVFNGTRPNNGYVIIAGDNRVPAVLGYSDTGIFEADNLPPAMQELLESYTEQIAALDNGETVSAHMTGQGAIAPLVPAVWSQNSPYYTRLPFVETGKHAAAGCVATAMAQVMYYYKWPTRTSETIPAYTSPTLSIYMPELPVTNFAWDLMQNTYQTTDTTSAAGIAAATLTLYCAQSVKMDFKNTSSSATTSYVPLAMTTYFGYQASCHTIHRANYTTQEWEQTIYNELAASRPVIYSGSKATGGHAFLCDGYDGNGLFHINWGWNGQSNGYFLLNVLNPDLQGTGSTGGVYGYIYRQAAIVGIEPGQDATSNFEITSTNVTLDSYSTTRTSSQSTFRATVSGRFNTTTSQVIAVDIGWGLYRGDVLIEKLYRGYNTALKPGYYLSSTSTALNFGAGISAGTYRILPIYSEYNKDNWRPCVGADKNYIEVTINGNQCSYRCYGTTSAPDYSVDDITMTGSMNHNRPVDIAVTLTNHGDSRNDLLYMHVNGTFTATGLVSIEKGETDRIEMRFMPTEAGTYTLTFSFNENGNNPVATRVLNINQMPTANLTSTITILDVTDAFNKIITSDKFSVELTITNVGTTTYREDISAKLFKFTQGNSGTNVQAKNQYIELRPNESTTVRFDMDNVVDGWKYFLKTYYYSNGEQLVLKSASMHTIHFPEEPQFIQGDVNRDGEINVADVNAVIGLILSGDILPAADVNNDGEINIADINTLINMILEA